MSTTFIFYYTNFAFRFLFLFLFGIISSENLICYFLRYTVSSNSVILGDITMDLSYQQLAEIIREKINSNEYVFGLALPSERELAKSFNVRRSLVRSAIEQLCTEGILKKYHGKGTYIMLKDIDDSSKHFKGMSELLKKAGYDPSSKILNTMTRKAGYKFSKIFDVSEDTEIFQVLRLRLGNEQPIAIENTYILHDSIPDIENIDFQIYSLYDLFRTNNIKIQDISHAFSTTKVHNTDARFLNLENDTSVIYVDVTSSLIDNQVVEYTEVLVRPEFSKYYTDGIFKNGIYQVNAQFVI